MLRVDVAPSGRARLADLLHRQGRYALAAESYARCFRESPPLETIGFNRYNAACSAALAGGTWRGRAFTWLRADLEAVRALAASDAAEAERRLRHWTTDPDLASIRDGEGLGEDFAELWADVGSALRDLSR